jgi:hypothetical protein
MKETTKLSLYESEGAMDREEENIDEMVNRMKHTRLEGNRYGMGRMK